ncbi:MAG: hypothetical protein NTY87_13450 [Planctomycetia bacterium]|nr:hypothetical protein [Planctomycetia bacterium]RLT13020.1 MAG: hypothetical protein DWI25_08050 [Planctomycetota bacterium]
MKTTFLRDQAWTPDGKLMTLHEHDGAFMIRVAGVELMSSRQHHSEELLAERACAHIPSQSAEGRVLIGGLGLGFTLREALKHLGPEARVVVVELIPEVIAWNLVPEYNLGKDALADSRVKLVQGDVQDLLRTSRAAFDAIILDVDNGASGLSVQKNNNLYTTTGLLLARAALKPAGCLAIWSAGHDPAFAEQMRHSGFSVTVERARTHSSSSSCNSLFIGRI